MADEPKDEKKDAKAAAPAEPKKGKAGGMVPIIAGVALLAAVGGGIGMFVVKSLSPAPVEKPGEGHGEAVADGHGEKPVEGHGDAGLLASGQELDPIDIKTNVSGSGGTRYVTLQVGIWVPKKDHPKINEPSVRRLIQARMEETLKTYQLEDLQSPNVMARMRKDFLTAIERLLRSVMPGRGQDDKFVLETTVTNLLTQ